MRYLVVLLTTALIIPSVLLGGKAAGGLEFTTVVVTLGYCLVFLDLMLEPLFAKITKGLVKREIAVRLGYLVFCTGLSFVSLYVSDGMILDYEFGEKADAYQPQRIEILPRPYSSGFLVYLVLELPPEKVRQLVEEKGLEKVENVLIQHSHIFKEELATHLFSDENRLEYYTNEEDGFPGNYKVIYDHHTKKAYYEHEVYSGEGS